ncbi:MAG: hypothetical protein ACTH3H_07565 [Micrococcaceae bacterium]|uniref:hypothetical protein n=1 Tax=Microbacterium sp. TaxID=51671 RepID=UPI003F9DF585
MDNDAATKSEQNTPDPLETLIEGLIDGSYKPNRAFKDLMAKWRNGELGVDLPPPGSVRGGEQRAPRSGRRPKASSAQPSPAVARRSPPRNAPKKDPTLAMVVAYSNGATHEEIADTHGVPAQTAHATSQVAGVVFRGGSSPGTWCSRW